MKFTDKAIEKKVREMVESTDDQAYTPLSLREKLKDEGYPEDQVTKVLVDMIETSKLSYYTNRRIGPEA